MPTDTKRHRIARACSRFLRKVLLTPGWPTSWQELARMAAAAAAAPSFKLVSSVAFIVTLLTFNALGARRHGRTSSGWPPPPPSHLLEHSLGECSEPLPFF